MTQDIKYLNPFDMLESAGVMPEAMAMPQKKAIEEINKALEGGWDINTLDQYGGTALIDACDRGLGEIALFLLEKGIDPKVHETTFNRTALHYAASKGLIEVVKVLVMKGLDVNESGKNGFTPLILAANEQRNAHLFNMKETDMATGKEVKDSKRVKDADKGYQDYIDTIEFLLENKADPNAATKEKSHTSLHYAGETRATEIIKLLFKYGAKPNLKAKEAGIIPLHFACRLDDVEAITVLVENGEDVNFQDEYGFTPLHEAVLANQVNIVKYLLEKGADPKIGVTKGFSPYTNKENAIDIAKDKGFKDILKLLEA